MKTLSEVLTNEVIPRFKPKHGGEGGRVALCQAIHAEVHKRNLPNLRQDHTAGLELQDEINIFKAIKKRLDQQAISSTYAHQLRDRIIKVDWSRQEPSRSFSSFSSSADRRTAAHTPTLAQLTLYLEEEAAVKWKEIESLAESGHPESIQLVNKYQGTEGSHLAAVSSVKPAKSSNSQRQWKKSS
jgi:hypothetical protein